MMPVADFLEKVGQGLEDGAKTVGRVAGAAAEPLGKAVVNEEAGYAPQIAAEGRQHQQAMDDAAIGVKAKVLESQLGQLQSNAPLFNADGSPMTPQQRSAALSGITDQYTQLYSHPRHAPQLMEALRKAVHPNGAVAGNGGAPTPAKAVGGFTAAAPEGADEDKDRRAKMADIDYYHDQLLKSGVSQEQANAFRNDAIARAEGAITGQPRESRGTKPLEQNGVAYGLEDQDTQKKYFAKDLEPGGSAPDNLKQEWSAIQGAEKDKAEAAEKAIKERFAQQDKLRADSDRQHDKSLAEMLSRMGDNQAFQAQMADYKSGLTTYRALDKQARDAEESAQLYSTQANAPGNKSAFDTSLITDYTSILAKGGRKTQAEIAFAQKIGGMGLQTEKMYTQATKGELPEGMRKLYIDYLGTRAKSLRDEAEASKPEPIQLPGRKGGVAQQLKPWKAPADAPPAPKEDNHTLKANGKVIAKSRGGQWVEPNAN